MKKKQAARQRLAAAFATIVLVFAVAMSGSAARADTGEPDYLVLNPDRE